jgi:hypothetical protein
LTRPVDVTWSESTDDARIVGEVEGHHFELTGSPHVVIVQGEELAGVDVVEWARSKGFSQLAAHVERLRAA